MKFALIVLAAALCSCTTATLERDTDGKLRRAETRINASDGQSVLILCDAEITTKFDYSGAVEAQCQGESVVLASQGGMSDPQTAGAGFGVLGDLFAVLKGLLGL